MSKTLIKLVDESILPSLLIVLSKVGGLALAVMIFNLEYEFNKATGGQIFPYELVFKTTNDLSIANSFSNILMILVPAIGFNFVLYKIRNFQDKRMTPKKIIKIADKDLLTLIETSRSVYLKAFIWIAFLWITIILAVITVAKAQAYIWTSVIAIGVGIISTLVLIKNWELDFSDKE